MKHPRSHAVHFASRLAFLVLLAPASALAGTVTVEGTANEIAVAVQDASLDDVMGQIGRAQGFEVERASGEPGAAISGRFTGPVGEVMANILQNESYLIENSAAAKAGIARIVLLGPAGKSETVAPAAVAANAGAAAPRPQPLPREVIAPAPTAGALQAVKRPRT